MNRLVESAIEYPLFAELVQASSVPVARSIEPDRDRFVALFDRMCQSRRFSNFGPIHGALSEALCAHLDASRIGLFSNATSALTLAMRALGVSGEVVTTPFSFAASAHSIVWAGAYPVFVDVDPIALTVDPKRVEAAITAKTTAILAVHIYGRPCDVVALQDIADRYGLALIYDAAHAFDTRIDGQPIHRFGDATIYSTHASKLFHTGEGGLIVANDPAVHERCVQLSNFGFDSNGEVRLSGFNAKMSELHAATGLAVMPQVAVERSARERLRKCYETSLAPIARIKPITIPANVRESLQYFAIRVDGSQWNRRDTARNYFHNCLVNHGINSRRYFYPLCTKFAGEAELNGRSADVLSSAVVAAEEVLCLPFHSAVQERTVEAIAEIARRTLSDG
jgi:dTDP-4-amino-4,6-dideoxygalactose transaminase